MKRLISILLILLLFTACDLRNRQDSADFIPEDSDIPAWSGWVMPTAGENSPELGNEIVKMVLNYSGEIPYSVPVQEYLYQLPMIDLAGSQATGCNQEIENRFGTLITQSMEAMMVNDTPILASLTYSDYVFSGILTLRVDRLDTDGETMTAYYTVDAENGEAVSLSRLFSAVGLSGSPEEIVNDAVLNLFTRRFGSIQGADPSVTTALNRTQAELAPLSAKRMHLTEDGRLAVDLELFSPNGGSSIEEIILP